MSSIVSLAVNPQSVETTSFKSTRYEHTVNGFIVDGDYILLKYDKRTLRITREQVINDVTPPFDVPEERLGIPILINPDSFMHIWKEKPEMWHPCWLVGEGNPLRIVSIVSGRTIGSTVPAPGLVSVRGFDNGVDGWKNIGDYIKSAWQAAGISIAEFVGPSKKSQILSALPSHLFYCSIAHGDEKSYCLDGGAAGGLPENTITPVDVALTLRNKTPYTLACAAHCGAMNYTGELSWARVFTKDKNTSIVVGFKNMGPNMQYGAVEAAFEFLMKFHYYYLTGHTVQQAYENALAEYPLASGYVDIYQGKYSTAQEPKNIITNVSPAGAGTITPTSGLYAPGEIGILASPNSGYEFDRIVLSVSFIGGTTTEDIIRNTTIGISMAPSGIYNITAYFKLAGQATQYFVRHVMYGEGTITPPGGYYSSGQVLNLQAVPALGWRFVRWSGDVSGTSAVISITVTRDLEFQAIFEQVSTAQATITMRVYPTAGGTTIPLPGSHVYSVGTFVPFSASAKPNYEFDYWRITTRGVDLVYPYSQGEGNVEADVALDAHFRQLVQAKKTLTINSSPAAGGRTTPATGTYNYNYGEIAEFTAIPNTGYRFLYWLATDSEGGSGKSFAEEEAVPMNVSLVVTAYFESTAPPPLPKYNLHTTCLGQGSVSPASGEFESGQVVNLKATPAAGWEFVSWGGNASGTSPNTFVVITKNTYVSATFKQLGVESYSLTVSVVGEGRVEPSGGTYTPNTVVGLAAYPTTGWRFKAWSGTSNNAANPTTVLMSSDKQISATFEQIEDKDGTTTQPPDLSPLLGSMVVMMMMATMSKISSDMGGTGG